MTEAEAKEAISAAWVAAWETAHPGVLTALGNEAATPPAGASLFSALWFGPIQDRQITQGPIGARRFECRGTVMVRLFGPVDVGESQLATAAGVVTAALASQTIAAGLYSVSASAVTAKSGGWWTNTIAIPFRYYDVR